MLGDGFLLAFAGARDAARCGIAVQRALAGPVEGSGGEPIRVRIGLHTGEALKDADRFFGKTVIQAYRIADQSEPGEILVSSVVKELVTDGEGEFSFEAAREVSLKGLRGTHQLYALRWAT